MAEDEPRVVLCDPPETDVDVASALAEEFGEGVEVTGMETPTAVATAVHGEPVGSVQCDPGTVALVANALVILVEGRKLASDVAEYLDELGADVRDATEEFEPGD